MMQVWANLGDAKLGDYVQTRRFGDLGRVHALHHSCPEKPSWFEMQMGLEDSDYTDSRWVSILCNDSGAVVVPVRDVEVVGPFPFTHRFADMYFYEDSWTTWSKEARERVNGDKI